MPSLPCNFQEGDWFDADAADHAVNFIETFCSHVKGHYGLFLLEPWQKDDIIRPLFGWKRADGLRKYRTCYVEIPRKNGKSSLTAAIALYLLLGTDEHGPEIISAAGDAAQARIVFETAIGMVKQSRTLNTLCNLTQYHIRYKNGFYRSISAEAKTKHGFNCSGVIFDELHVQTDRTLWDVLTTSVGSRKQPVIIALTTAGHDRSSICWEQHEYALGVASGRINDPSYLPVVYAADADDDWTSEETWRKANPGYGSICNADYFRDQVLKAKESPSHVNTFKRLNLNIWTSGENAWLTDEEWMGCAKGLPDDDYLQTLPCFGGLDLAATRDLVAFAMVWVDEDCYYIRTHQWVNSEKANTKSLNEGVDYIAFAEAGHVSITPGNVTNYEHVERYVVSAQEQFSMTSCAFDRKFSPYIVPSLMDAGVPMAPFGQGYYEMSYPTKQLEMEIVAGNLVHDGNPCLRWQIGCSIITRDPADNIKITKSRLKGGQMVDGVVASVMAFGEMLKHKESGATLEVLSL